MVRDEKRYLSEGGGVGRQGRINSLENLEKIEQKKNLSETVKAEKESEGKDTLSFTVRVGSERYGGKTSE